MMISFQMEERETVVKVGNICISQGVAVTFKPSSFVKHTLLLFFFTHSLSLYKL